MPFDPGTFTLAGKEVTLRPLETGDAEGLALAAAESREHFGYTIVPDGIDGAKRYIDDALRQRAAGDRHPFTVIWRGRIVGSTSYYEFQPWHWPAGSELQRIDAPDALEIGYTWLAASAQRTRCNTGAKFLLLRHAFDAWQVHRVSFRTDARNERSRRAIERLGATFEGIRRAHVPASDSTVRDSAYYSIVRSEWPEVNARLVSALERYEKAIPPGIP